MNSETYYRALAIGIVQGNIKFKYMHSVIECREGYNFSSWGKSLEEIYSL